MSWKRGKLETTSDKLLSYQRFLGVQYHLQMFIQVSIPPSTKVEGFQFASMVPMLTLE
jgi:hypothetical protein